MGEEIPHNENLFHNGIKEEKSGGEAERKMGLRIAKYSYLSSMR
jgi:hypothetical protein